MFTPIPVEVLAYEPEVVGLDLLHKTKFTKLRHVEPIPDLARVSEGTAKLEMMLDAVIQVTHLNLSCGVGLSCDVMWENHWFSKFIFNLTQRVV